MSDLINKKEELKQFFGFYLDDFQIEAVNHIDVGKSVVLCAPTGAGKTVIAEHAINRAFEQGKRVFYTTPLKALSNQKFHDFSKRYGEENVGLLTGDISINRDAQVVVMTTEVFRNMLYGTNLGRIEESLRNVQYVVLDEVHYMNDEQRGTVWEESIIYCPNNVQLVALSATVANSQELTDWINTVHGDTELVYTDFRPVPLRHFYYSDVSRTEVLPLFAPGGKLNSRIKPEKKSKFDKATKVKAGETIMNLVNVLYQKDMLPAIFFTFSRRKCDNYLQDCAKLRLLNQFEEKRIMKVIDDYILDNPYLAKHRHLEYLYHGVASHHAGLLPAWKVLVEKLFQQGLIKVVFATETLAAGINMPARSTVITSISKRCDDGHRILTANEFLQMSGRAGRRGMDEVGYVTVVGSSFESPEEVAELVSSASEPLQSKFTPSYSMVLNLLQRFSVDEARELILKSFGYFSSSQRLRPLYAEQERVKNIIYDIENFECPHRLTGEALLKYNKLKNTYVEYRKIANTLKKQAKRSKIFSPEVIEYDKKAKDLFKQMESVKCNYCKHYKRHIKELEILDRFQRRYQKVVQSIELEKDIYWRQFINLSSVLTEMGYLKDNYPTEKGMTTAAVRAENELFFSELILQGVLNELSPAVLAGLLLAISTEEGRNDRFFVPMSLSGNIRKVINDSRDILRRIHKVQKNYSVEMPMNLNPKFSPLIEFWVNGGEWDVLMKGLDIGEGDIVRAFKRTVDLLRQLTNIPNVPEEVSKMASIAMDCINRDPITEE